MARVALVTGGMGGLGTAMCKALAASGHKIATTYIGDDAPAHEWVAKMKADGIDALAVKCDVTSFEDAEKAVAEVVAKLGPVDVLVNNAGITRDGMFKKMTLDQWLAVINTNLNSAFNMTKQVFDGMNERGFGRVINISSINGQKGQMGQANYSAAKAGIHGFTMALAQEGARKGVTVNTIAPGYIGTDMVMAIAEEVRNKIIAGVPMQRLGKPEEIAGLVNYLASDISAFMTGAELAINGGQHMM
jgi:acetoacetyl-CoA reductase